MTFSEIEKFCGIHPKPSFDLLTSRIKNHTTLVGGSGFLGGAITEALTKQGNNVVILGRCGTKEKAIKNWHRFSFFPNSELVEFIEYMPQAKELSKENLTKLVSSQQIINLVSELNVSKSFQQLYASNSLSAYILPFLAKMGIQIIHISSLSVFASSNYGQLNHLLTCKADSSLSNLHKLTFYGGYAASKVAAEILIKNAYTSGDLTIVRLPLLINSSLATNPQSDLYPRFINLLNHIKYVPESIPHEEVSLLNVHNAANFIINLGRVGYTTTHHCETNTSLENIVSGLKLLQNNYEFENVLKGQKGINKALLLNAFCKPQPIKLFNYDIFHSTNLKYKT